MNNQAKLLYDLKKHIYHHCGNDWQNRIINDNKCVYHIAIMKEPYLSAIFSFKKVIESRMTQNRISPFKKASVGDVVLLKKSGGAYEGVFRIEEIMFFESVDNDLINYIKEHYENQLRLQDGFWEQKKTARYITLIRIGDLERFPPYRLNQINRQSWITLGKSASI